VHIGSGVIPPQSRTPQGKFNIVVEESAAGGCSGRLLPSIQMSCHESKNYSRNSTGNSAIRNFFSRVWAAFTSSDVSVRFEARYVNE
jgi:hypothetical protein